jgi:outer membrane immunogenic protein
MTKWLMGLALALGFVSPALAQEYNWTGLYLGVHAGYGWGEHEGDGKYEDFKVLDPETGAFDVDGTLAGGQLGFNIQTGRFVFGLEGDGSWTGLEGAGSFASDANDNGTADYTWNIQTDVEWLASLRGRVGFLVTPALFLYGTGGVAWAGLDSSESVICHAEQCLAGNDPTTVRAKSSETTIGWVAGAGGEWRFAPRWSLKVEWQHYEFDDVNSHFKGTAYPDNDPLPAMPYASDSFPGSVVIDTAKVGLNYKF